MYGSYYPSQPQPLFSMSIPPGPPFRPYPQYQYSNQPNYAPYRNGNSYFPIAVHPPPLPMDPANPRFSSRSPIHRPPPKAKLGGPTGRPYTPSPTDSSSKGEWRGSKVNVKLPTEPYRTTWDLRVDEWRGLRRGRNAEDVPLPLSPMAKGSTWPLRNDVMPETEQWVNGLPSEATETISHEDVESVSRFGMVKEGRLKVVIPDSTAWLRLIQDAADRLAAQQVEADRQIFGDGEAMDSKTFNLPSAPRLKAVRSLSDRTLLHPSPTRPKFAFKQLSDFVRRLSVDEFSVPSPLVLPGARQETQETPTKQLFKPAVGQLGDVSSSNLSVSAIPFIPKGPSAPPPPVLYCSPPSSPRYPTLSRSAAAYLPSWVEPNYPQDDRVYPSVKRYEPPVSTRIATSVMRPRADTMAFGDAQQVMDATYPAHGHGGRFQSQDSLRWFAPVEAGPDVDEFEYDMGSRSASEFSNPSDEDEYIRRRLATRSNTKPRQRQWSSSSPCQSHDSSDSFGVQKQAKRRIVGDEGSSVSDEANERSKARAKPLIRPARSKQARLPSSPAATASNPSARGSISLNPDAQPFLFGAPQPFMFRSPLPPQKLDTAIVATRSLRLDTSRQTHTPTETYVTADGSPLRTARALQADAVELEEHHFEALREVSNSRGSNGVAIETLVHPGHPHMLKDETGEDVASTLVSSLAEGFEDDGHSSSVTPLSTQFALEPDVNSSQTSPTPDWTPEKRVVEKEIQKDIMMKWRFPVTPDKATSGYVARSTSLASPGPVSPSPGSDIERRTRRPIPSFDAPLGELQNSLEVPSGDVWPGGDSITSTHTSVEFPMRVPTSSFAVTNAVSATPSEAGTITSTPEISKESRAAADHGAALQNATAEVPEDLKRVIAECIESSLASELLKANASNRSGLADSTTSGEQATQTQRIERFMERIADVLEQQSRLLLDVTQDPYPVEDQYPHVKTHTEELLSALVAGQHTLLDQVGNMHELRELLEGAPAAISRAAETLDAAQEALSSKSTLQAEMQTLRQEHLGLQTEGNHQLSKARAAHGQARSELELSNEQLHIVKAERDALRQQLDSKVAETVALQEAKLRADQEGAVSASATEVEQRAAGDLRNELIEVKRQLVERQATFESLQKEQLAKDATAEGMVGTILSLAEQVSAQADREAASRQQIDSALQEIRESVKDRGLPATGQANTELPEMRSKLRASETELSSLKSELVGFKQLYAATMAASEAQVSDLRSQLAFAESDRRQTQDRLQAALSVQAKSDGKIEASMAREVALRQQYGDLHRWASDCRRALQRSEALRCQPFIVHDVHTGDYAEIVTPLNCRDLVLPKPRSASMEASSSQDSAFSSNAPMTPVNARKQSSSPSDAGIMTPPPTVTSKSRLASS